MQCFCLDIQRRWVSFVLCLVIGGFLGCGPSQKEVRDAENTAKMHYNLAYGHYFDSTRPNVDAAMQEVLKSLTARPNYPEAHMLAGLIYLGREQYTKAIRHFKRALDIRPTYHAAANNLGTAYLASGRWDDAIRLYGRLVGNIMYATPGHGQNNLGWAYYKKGKLKEARRHFTMAINLAPRLCPALNNLGMLLIDERRMARAEKYLMRAQKYCPNYAEPRFHLGRLMGMKNDPGGALEHFKSCLKLAGDSPLADRCEQRVLALSERR